MLQCRITHIAALIKTAVNLTVESSYVYVCVYTAFFRFLHLM